MARVTEKGKAGRVPRPIRGISTPELSLMVGGKVVVGGGASLASSAEAEAEATEEGEEEEEELELELEEELAEEERCFLVRSWDDNNKAETRREDEDEDEDKERAARIRMGPPTRRAATALSITSQPQGGKMLLSSVVMWDG